MKIFRRYQKIIAAFLLVVFTTNLLTPNIAYGLTSGPDQPEMKGFEPIGNSDMVDLFSGDFSYNIPLMDVGGYPVNLAYHSGASMDDEASWVGYGWGLNVGSLNRNLRGIPDDFDGTDKMEREMSMKDHKTYGGRFSMTLDLLGMPIDKIIKKGNKKKKLNLSLTLSVGVKYDNYRGIGAELGANTGVSMTEYTATPNTAAEGQKSNADTTGEKLPLSGSFGLNLSSQDGASLSLNSSILKDYTGKNDKLHGITSSIGFGYNTRAGLSEMTLGSSFSIKEKAKEEEKQKTLFSSDFYSSSISFNGNTYSPTIDHPTKSNSYNFTLHVGPELNVAFPGIGVTGFYSNQSVAQKIRQLPGYGFLHSDEGKNSNNAMMDFNREKDIPYSKEVKYMPIPVPTYDLFSATSQDGGGQYRLFRGSSGVFFDPRTKTKNDNFSLGIEFGAGLYVDAGVDLYKQDINTTTKKWTDRNFFLAKGDYQGKSSSAPTYETAYFKRVGEPVPYDKDYVTKIKNTKAVAVKLKDGISDPVSGAAASDLVRTKDASNGESIPVLKRDKREVRNTTFSYLTAKEAANHGLEKTIKDYKPDSIAISGCSTGAIKNNFNRVGGYRLDHHFSEITVTGDDGKRSVYGIPVYNTSQQEVSFSIDENLAARNKGLVKYSALDDSVVNKKGRENYFSKEKTPPYATSYLLTAILSPDYVDRTGNGITDDDAGTAVKFNYTRHLASYKWRTPFAFGPDTANYNEGFLSDDMDDKANYVYGEKEIWYLHSIESKTMVALFVTADRLDGLGVKDKRGEVDTLNKLRRLKEIRLYSKSDLQMNGNDPAQTIPIKVVHFEYDYSICKGLPNSIGNKGKLTLNRIYFTFGLNQKGRLNPYDFKYDTTFNFYNYRQYDRWGNFKDASRNPGGLNNSEFPYTIQNKAMADSFASAWQLNKIILPSGGMINIKYEADDYGYVQDRRASEMCMLNGVGAVGAGSGLRDADYIYVNLPEPVTSGSNAEMREKYFDGITNLYFKTFLDLDGNGHKEFVPGYAEIDPAMPPVLETSSIAKIKLKKIKKVNPITKAGWQFIRTNLPKYAYPGSDNLASNQSNLRKAIEALVTAFTNIKELISGFESRAKNKGYSDKVDLNKSWVRLCSPSWKKIGGGSRVRRIDISDDWANMSGTTGAQTSTYSQLYDYTTKDTKDRIVSTGVASYEPLLGNDENPFRQPIRYKQSQFLALNNYYYIEEPFGESFFPAASVGYSKVTVKTIGTGDAETVNRTGTVISEFFTAKDYPVKIDILGLEHKKPISGQIFKLIGGVSFDMVGLSQGYSIETNDMHGKPKSVQVKNKSGQVISSVDYYYKSANDLTSTRELKNDVKVIRPDGTVTDGTIGMDVEMYTDMRQEITDNLGVSVKISGGSGAILIFPLPFFFPGLGINYDRRNFRSSSTVKIVNRFAIQYKTVKMENGSSITSENLLWDAETGNVLLTKTQNEFDDPVYSFAYPAHWIYDGMGQAYQNLGTLLTDFSSGTNGVINNSQYNDLLVPGDELININSSTKYWVINSSINNSSQKRIIDEHGIVQSVSGITVKLIRSGRRNMANTAVATIASLNNPIVGDKLDITQLTKILDAKATVFNEKWSVPVSSDPTHTSSGQQCTDPACLLTFLNAAICTQVPQQSRKNLYAIQSDQQQAGSIMKSFLEQGGSLVYGNCFYSFSNGRPADSMNYYLNSPHNTMIGCTSLPQLFAGDTATLGNCKLIFDYVNNSPQAIQDYNNCMDIKPAGYQTPCNGAGCARDGFRIINDSCGFTLRKVAIAYNGECYYDSILYDIFKVHTICSPVTVGACQSPVSGTFNPYYTGILGNWRPESQSVYQVSRENLTVNANKGSTNIRKSGAYSVFSPFWRYDYNASTPKWVQVNNNENYNNSPYSDVKWIAANQVTYFNSKGLEIENKDALNRYSAALFGYLESMPVAVASNSRYREIAFDGFEDYGFNVDCNSVDTCNKGHFNFKKLLNGNTIDTTSLYAHSGKYSLKLNGNATITKTVYLGDIISLYNFNSSGEYILQGNELAKGFSPLPGKKYVLSFWVKDGSPRSANTTVQASVNGVNLINSSQSWPIVEGWKRVETQFVLPTYITSFNLQLQSGGAVYFDDIRIHPFDGQMKSFAYDPSSQRLMAEMDENNFATFYEYDDEGILVRVKKETERGIMTIKETRSSYKKRQ